MLIENTKDINTYHLEEFYGTLMTYELNHAETKEKSRNAKDEEKNDSTRRQITLKSSNDEETSNSNKSDDELDDLVLFVKK